MDNMYKVDNNDVILYKYRSYERGMEVINKQQLYLASPVKFEDPQDCLPAAFSDVNEVILHNRMVQILTRDCKYYSIFYHKRLFTGTKMEWDEIVARFYAGEIVDDVLSSLLFDLTFRILRSLTNLNLETVEWFSRKRLRVLCLCKSPCIPPMWEKYADNHTGIVIGISKKRLQEKYKCNIFDVVYSSERPVYSFGKMTLQDRINMLTTKSLEWSFENESRVIFTEPMNYIDVSDLIVNVIFGKQSAMTQEILVELKDKFKNIHFAKEE